MINFKKFLEEVTIKGNPGIPGEGYKMDKDKDYLSDIEKRAKEKLRITGREDVSQMYGEMSNHLKTSNKFIIGNERKLEILAENVIRQYFGDILEDVLLDIQLYHSNKEIKKFLDQESSKNAPNTSNLSEITDPELIKKIHKAKIGNNIIQGEAKNTKHILHTREVKDGLKRIYGEEDSKIIFDAWDNISKIADKLDWIIPIDSKSKMMAENPEGMAGAVKVDWIENSPEDEDDDYDFLDDDENDDENYKEDNFSTPVIIARGIDFPMLLHETVKGIYELIASVSQPGISASIKEIEDAEKVMFNVSSFEDEAEDFRTGPEIASDFRDFINENPNSDYHPNIRAFIFGKMMDESYMSADEFLELFRGILNKTKSARIKIDYMISEIVEELKEYESDLAFNQEEYDDSDHDNDFEDDDDDDFGDYSFFGDDDDDDNDQDDYEDDNYEDDDFDDLMLDDDDFEDDDFEDDLENDDSEEIDYSELSQRELQSLIDEYLDKRDFEEVKKLSKYLKEGREIYLRDIRMIKERKNNRKR